MHKLGLTYQEAKIYLISSHIGKQTIKQISTLVDIERSNTYNIIKKLHKAGLFVEMIGRPNLYEAIPIEQGVSTLLRFKEQEYNSAAKEAKYLLDKRNISSSIKPAEYEFRIARTLKKTFQQGIMKSCEVAERSFDLLLSSSVFFWGFLQLAESQLQCVKRGVNYRVIVEREVLSKKPPILNAFLKYENFKIRGVSEHLRIEGGIGDKKFANMFLTPRADLEEALQLRTNHPGFIELMQNYFDAIWNDAQEYS